jgi:hypothetical protein
MKKMRRRRKSNNCFSRKTYKNTTLIRNHLLTTWHRSKVNCYLENGDDIYSWNLDELKDALEKFKIKNSIEDQPTQKPTENINKEPTKPIAEPIQPITIQAGNPELKENPEQKITTIKIRKSPQQSMNKNDIKIVVEGYTHLPDTRKSKLAYLMLKRLHLKYTLTHSIGSPRGDISIYNGFAKS